MRQLLNPFLRRAPLLAALLALAIALTACGDDDDSVPSPNPTLTHASVTTTAAVSPSPTTSPATGAPFPRVDGAVPAQGFGGTGPVTIKPNPDPLPGIATLVDVRIGAHPEEGGWDRIVFEFRGGLPPGDVRYDTKQATQCGSGMPVAVRSAGRMFVRFDQTNAHTEAGQPTIQKRELPGPGSAIIEAKQTCDFEAVVEWVVGVDAPERFNVRKLENPPRVVIDIKQ